MEEIKKRAKELAKTVPDDNVRGLIYEAFKAGANYMKERIPYKCNPVTLINYLDAHRPIGKMCLSNMECEDLERAFRFGYWRTVISYIKKME